MLKKQRLGKFIKKKILKNKLDTLDKELVVNNTFQLEEQQLQRELFHYTLLIIGAVLYIFFNNFFSQTISFEHEAYERLLITVFVFYPLVCCIFGAFIAIFKVRKYNYLQRLSIAVFKLLAMFFIAIAFMFTVYQISALFIKL